MKTIYKSDLADLKKKHLEIPVLKNTTQIRNLIDEFNSSV